MDVSLPKLAELEEGQKMVKLCKSFGKKYPELLDLIDSKLLSDYKGVITEKQAAHILQKHVKDVSSLFNSS